MTPFCFFDFPRDWLNIQYLYLVSVGFIMILSSGTVLASRLLYQRRWRRFIPYALPLFFVFLSQFIIFHLDKNYERLAAAPQTQRMKPKSCRMKYEARGNGAPGASQDPEESEEIANADAGDSLELFGKPALDRSLQHAQTVIDRALGGP